MTRRRPTILLALALALCLGVGQARATMSALGGRFINLTALSTTLSLLRAKPSFLMLVNCNSTAAAVSFIQFFDASATTGITLGSTAPVGWLVIPIGFSSQLVNANFTNGMVAAATTTATGNVAPSAALVCSMTAQ